jgi:hypothetical protein
MSDVNMEMPQQENLEEKERRRKIEDLLKEQEAAFMEAEKVLLIWKAPARAFKERSREYFTTIGAIVLLVAIILIFIREFLLVAVILAFAFVAYVLASVKPEEVEHTITTRGIRTGGKFYRWDTLGRFWFEDKFGNQLLVIETMLSFPNRLILLLNHGVTQETVVEALRRYLLNETPMPGFLDKAGDWLSKKVPLEES